MLMVESVRLISLRFTRGLVMKRSAFVKAMVLAAAAALLVGVLNPDLDALQSVTSAAVDTPLYRGNGSSVRGGELQSLDTAAVWINSPPLTAPELRGKVVLVQFGTYTCINWIRTLPYVRAWSDKYGKDGLVVIAVHTPEFSFETDLGNVRRHVSELKVGFPLAVDNERAIWRAFRNNYWPAIYLIDAQGRIRYSHFGEGEYEKSERMIQQLLSETGKRPVGDDVTGVAGVGIEAEADWANLRSPETYVGFARTENFSSPGGAALNKRRSYAVPKSLRLNEWALAGDWTMGPEATLLNQANGRVVHRFHARDLHLVMGPARAGATVRFRVLIDGQAPGAAHGLDVDALGMGTATTHRMYQLLRQRSPIADRLFEIEFLDPGVDVFSFTFG
jgi:thiol-disulfide isomerase/thioredoxin